jgi:hypothetical protein
MMFRLLAGRGAFRLAIQLMGVVLIAVWVAHDYGRFANAIGLTTWLVFVPTAAEKAALKILPRTRRTRTAVAGMAVRTATIPALVVLAALVISLAVSPSSPTTTYLTAAAWSIAGGLLMTLSGLHRLRGKSNLDATAFACAAAVVVLTTAATWLVRWSPETHLLLLLGGIIVIIGVSLVALPAQWRRGAATPGHRLFPAFGRSTVLLGLTDLLDVAAVSAVFGILALSGRTTDSGLFYLALMASSAFCSLLLYQLKLHQPRTSRRMRGTGAAAGRARACSLLRGSERAGLVFAVVVAVSLAVPGARALLLEDGTIGSYAVLVVLVAVETTLYAVVLYAGFLVENTNNSVLTLTSTSALLGLSATVALAGLLVPAFGPAGGFVALILAIAVKAFALRRMLLRRHPELADQ